MKKLWVFLLALLVCFFASGCSNGEVETLKEQNATLEKKLSELETQKSRQAAWYKSEDFSDALQLFDEYIETEREQAGVPESGTLQVVRLDKISERYYLVTYMTSPAYLILNCRYALIDFEKGSCTQINPDTADFISDATYDESTITFYCDGRNVVNGFRDFPHSFKYNIAKKEFTKEYIYNTLPYGEVETRLGNGVSKVGLSKVTESDKKLVFDFSQIEGTLLAGGNFCPAIRIGRKMTDMETRTVYVDFKALVLSSGAEKQLRELEKKDYISAVSIKNYKDVQDVSHCVVYFELDGIDGYSCRFEEDENGFMDLVLLLK